MKTADIGASLVLLLVSITLSTAPATPEDIRINAKATLADLLTQLRLDVNKDVKDVKEENTEAQIRADFEVDPKGMVPVVSDSEVDRKHVRIIRLKVDYGLEVAKICSIICSTMQRSRITEELKDFVQNTRLYTIIDIGVGYDNLAESPAANSKTLLALVVIASENSTSPRSKRNANTLIQKESVKVIPVSTPPQPVEQTKKTSEEKPITNLNITKAGSERSLKFLPTASVDPGLKRSQSLDSVSVRGKINSPFVSSPTGTNNGDLERKPTNGKETKPNIYKSTSVNPTSTGGEVNHEVPTSNSHGSQQGPETKKKIPVTWGKLIPAKVPSPAPNSPPTTTVSFETSDGHVNAGKGAVIEIFVNLKLKMKFAGEETDVQQIADEEANLSEQNGPNEREENGALINTIRLSVSGGLFGAGLVGPILEAKATIKEVVEKLIGTSTITAIGIGYNKNRKPDTAHPKVPLILTFCSRKNETIVPQIEPKQSEEKVGNTAPVVPEKPFTHTPQDYVEKATEAIQSILKARKIAVMLEKKHTELQDIANEEAILPNRKYAAMSEANGVLISIIRFNVDQLLTVEEILIVISDPLPSRTIRLAFTKIPSTHKVIDIAFGYNNESRNDTRNDRTPMIVIITSEEISASKEVQTERIFTPKLVISEPKEVAPINFHEEMSNTLEKRNIFVCRMKNIMVTREDGTIETNEDGTIKMKENSNTLVLKLITKLREFQETLELDEQAVKVAKNWVMRQLGRRVGSNESPNVDYNLVDYKDNIELWAPVENILRKFNNDKFLAKGPIKVGFYIEKMGNGTLAMALVYRDKLTFEDIHNVKPEIEALIRKRFLSWIDQIRNNPQEKNSKYDTEVLRITKKVLESDKKNAFLNTIGISIAQSEFVGADTSIRQIFMNILKNLEQFGKNGQFLTAIYWTSVSTVADNLSNLPSVSANANPGAPNETDGANDSNLQSPVSDSSDKTMSPPLSNTSLDANVNENSGRRYQITVAISTGIWFQEYLPCTEENQELLMAELSKFRTEKQTHCKKGPYFVSCEKSNTFGVQTVAENAANNKHYAKNTNVGIYSSSSPLTPKSTVRQVFEDVLAHVGDNELIYGCLPLQGSIHWVISKNELAESSQTEQVLKVSLALYRNVLSEDEEAQLEIEEKESQDAFKKQQTRIEIQKRREAKQKQRALWK